MMNSVDLLITLQVNNKLKYVKLCENTCRNQKVIIYWELKDDY